MYRNIAKIVQSSCILYPSIPYYISMVHLSQQMNYYQYVIIN